MTRERMTREEAIDTIKCNYPPSHYSMLCEALDMAMDTLENAEKYRWHDLRKDPNDLPSKSTESVLTEHKVCGIRCYAVCQYTDNGFEDGVNPAELVSKTVVAWKEIEPHEVEE